MAGKRRKKHAATEVKAAPDDAATRVQSTETHVEVPATPGKAAVPRGAVRVTPKAEQARKKATGATAAGKVPVTRAEVAPSPAKGTAAAAPDNGSSAEDREQQIRERAYHLWKHAGEPHGQHDDHWSLAEKQLEED